ncbi:MAG: FimB/Mfa2 family fimbrial subunit [Dysgonamonadaceae bacterium]|jgi:hypothetical protein|nr:FimB/Mfa2 family fimbrial subunit [Dysgonamonadaceae bacterium]
MIKRLLFFSLLSLLAISCIKEDSDDCQRGLRLNFSYTHNNQDKDLLSEQVRNIRVFLFDQSTGILTDVVLAGTQDIARGYIDVNLAEGIYTAIAWGGSSIDMFQDNIGGYTDVATVGTTTLDQFRRMLAYDPLSGNALADVTPKVKDFDDLFYAAATDLSVTGWNRHPADLAFIKNTNTLKVVVTGLEHLRSGTSPLNIFSTGKNWQYRYNNAPDASVPRMLYMPQTETATANATEVLIKQQRLNMSQLAVDPVLLYIRDVNGADLITPLNVIETIRQNPAYQTQADIDREDLFTITMEIEPGDSVTLTVTITINDWIIVDTGTILM